MGRTSVLAALFIATAVPAAADQPTQPRISASVGAGVATPFHSDLPSRATAWQASLRAALAPHLLIEGSFGEWRRTTSRVTTDTIVQGPAGVLGRVDRITQRTQYVRPAIGFNLLAAGSVGRVTVSAGGGPGVLLYRRRFTQLLEGCEGSAVRCGETESRFSSGSFSLQAVGGVDVAITARLRAFGDFRIAAPLRDVGSGEHVVVAGVRVAVW